MIIIRCIFILTHTSLHRNGTELQPETLPSFTLGSAVSSHFNYLSSLFWQGLLKISQYSSLKLSLFPINEDWCWQVYCSCKTLLNCTLNAKSVVAHYKYKDDDSIKYLSLWECSGWKLMTKVGKWWVWWQLTINTTKQYFWDRNRSNFM